MMRAFDPGAPAMKRKPDRRPLDPEQTPSLEEIAGTLNEAAALLPEPADLTDFHAFLQLGRPAFQVCW